MAMPLRSILPFVFISDVVGSVGDEVGINVGLLVG